MIMLFRLLAILCLFVNVSSYAVDCYQNKRFGNTEINKPMPAFKVPQDAEIGQKIWESDDINTKVFCNRAVNWSESNPYENVHAWIKIAEFNDSSVINNPYLTFGVTYNGQDYEGNNQGIDTGYCLDRANPFQIVTDTCTNTGVLQTEVTFNARFRLYVKLKQHPPKDTKIDFSTVNILQFDGSQGANTDNRAKNLHANITGLDNISFLDCSIDIRIFPESQIVNFGRIDPSTIVTIPPTATFDVSTIRDATANCSEQFDVATSFYTDDTLYDNTHLEMGNGLIMHITDQVDKTDMKFNQYKLFTTYKPNETPAVITRSYQAKLTTEPGATLVYGPFQKDLIVKINYN